MIGPSSTIQLEQLLILADERFVTRLSRQGTSFLRRGDGFHELPGFSVSRGERADHKSPPEAGQLAGLLGEPDGLSAVAKIGLRTRGHDPGQVIQDVRRLRSEGQSSSIALDGILEFPLSSPGAGSLRAHFRYRSEERRVGKE